MINIGKRITKITMINKNFFEVNKQVELKKEGIKLKRSLSKEVQDLINNLQAYKELGINNMNGISKLLDALNNKKIIEDAKDESEVSYQSIRRYSKYKYDSNELLELLKDYLYNTEGGYEITRHAGWTDKEQEVINACRLYDSLFTEDERWHSFLGTEQDIKDIMYAPPGPEYGEQLSWDDYCIKHDREECSIDSLHKAYIYNQMLVEYIDKILSQLCSYLGHDYQAIDDESEYYHCKCTNCKKIKRVSSSAWHYDSGYRVIQPGQEVLDYMKYISSLNMKDFVNNNQKRHVLNKKYFKDPRMPRHVSLKDIELIKI